MYHGERCNIDEIAGYLRCCRADVRWALGIRSHRTAAKRLRARLSKWHVRKPNARTAFIPALGLQVNAFRADGRHG